MTSDLIEQEGIELAKEELQKAHSVILVLDVSDLIYQGDGIFTLSEETYADIDFTFSEE